MKTALSTTMTTRMKTAFYHNDHQSVVTLASGLSLPLPTMGLASLRALFFPVLQDTVTLVFYLPLTVLSRGVR